MKAKKKYGARFERGEDGVWTAIAKVAPRETAVSDGATLDKARSRIRESIAALLDADADSFLIEEDVVLPERAKRAVRAHAKVKAELHELAGATREAAREAIVELTSFGLPMREVGKMLGVTGPRVHQVIAETKGRHVLVQKIVTKEPLPRRMVRTIAERDTTRGQFSEYVVHGKTGKVLRPRKPEGRKSAG